MHGPVSEVNLGEGGGGKRGGVCTSLMCGCRFGCMFVQHLVSCDSSGHPVPPCLLHKASHLPSFCLPFPTFCMPVSVCVCIVSAHQQMVYIYRREKFLQTHAYTKQPPPPTHSEIMMRSNHFEVSVCMCVCVYS